MMQQQDKRSSNDLRETPGRAPITSVAGPEYRTQPNDCQYEKRVDHTHAGVTEHAFGIPAQGHIDTAHFTKACHFVCIGWQIDRSLDPSVRR